MTYTITLTIEVHRGPCQATTLGFLAFWGREREREGEKD
jgi:hypothetical protein